MRQESDREDLLLEAVNMPTRGRVRMGSQEWIIGWRSSGAVSLYQNADPVFQFNALGQWRRAYVDGMKLVAEDGQWNRLIRTPDSSGRFRFVTQPICKEEADKIQRQWGDCVKHFREAIEQGQWEAVGTSVKELRYLASQWVDALTSPPKIADRPSG